MSWRILSDLFDLIELFRELSSILVVFMPGSLLLICSSCEERLLRSLLLLQGGVFRLADEADTGVGGRYLPLGGR